MTIGGSRPGSDRDLVDSLVEAWEAELADYGSGQFQFVPRVVRMASIISDAIAECLVPWGLNSTDYGVLGTLRAASPAYTMRPSDLSSRLLMSSGGMTKVLSRLESAQYIERVRDPVDGRSVWVRLTSVGVQTADAMLRAWSQRQRELFGALPGTVAQEASDVLRTVLLALGDDAPIPRGLRAASPHDIPIKGATDDDRIHTAR